MLGWSDLPLSARQLARALPRSLLEASGANERVGAPSKCQWLGSTEFRVEGFGLGSTEFRVNTV